MSDKFAYMDYTIARFKKGKNHNNNVLDALKVMMLLGIGDIRKYTRYRWAQSSSLHDEMLDTCNDVCTIWSSLHDAKFWTKCKALWSG